MSGRSRCLFVALAACFLAGATARADLAYELSPAAGGGAADNVSATGQHYGDVFTLIGGTMRVRYAGPRSTHFIGYTLGYSKYMEKRYPDTLSHSVAWLSTVTPSPMLTLHLGANGTLTRSSGIDASDPGAFVPETVVAGPALYLTTTATQGIELQPSARWKFTEVLNVGYVRYLDAMTVNGMAASRLPRTILATVGLRGEREVGRDAYSGELDATDSSTTYATTMTANPVGGHWLLARLLAGWRHELSPTWSTSLQAGPSVMYLIDGPSVLAPAVIASLNYNELPWFASLTVQQTPTPNPFLGGAILGDQVLARLIVPLTRNERVVAGGVGGYTYARIADANGHFERAYDQFMGGVSLVYRFAGVPFAASANYTVASQRGGSVPGYQLNSFAYQYVFVTLRGDLAWGTGRPPVFGGAK